MIRREVWPFLAAGAATGVVTGMVRVGFGGSLQSGINAGVAVAAVICAYMLFFFRDPKRSVPSDPDAVVAAAEGVVAKIVEMDETTAMHERTVRISIFLSLFDVHVNRAPIAGRSKFLGYFPGKRLFTFQEKSSEVNQHNSILITGDRTRCLVKQIVGPVCRRVVYWPDPNAEVELDKGAKIGMMKFGSRMDMYLPVNDVDVVVSVGDKVRAGETVVARMRRNTA